MLVKHIESIINALCVMVSAVFKPPLTLPHLWANTVFHIIAIAHIWAIAITGWLRSLYKTTHNAFTMLLMCLTSIFQTQITVILHLKLWFYFHHKAKMSNKNLVVFRLVVLTHDESLPVTRCPLFICVFN